MQRSASRTGKAKWEARSTACSSKHSSIPGTREALTVGAHDLPAGFDARVKPRQAAEPQRRPRLVQAVVEADVDDVIGGVVAAVAVPGAARHRWSAAGARGRPAASSALATMPPSPTHSCFLEKKLEGPRARRPSRPDARRHQAAPIAWAQSSISIRPCSSHSSRSSAPGRVAAEVHGDDRPRAA